MYFRPYPILTILMVPALILLAALGSWQVQRMAWKQAELDAYAAAREHPAADLHAALCAGEAMRGRPLRFAPESEGGRVRVQGVNADNRPGWRVFTLAPAPACLEAEAILVERAFIPLHEETRAPVFVSDWRVDEPVRPGAFTPPPDRDGEGFYAYDRAGMAAALGLEAEALASDWWVAADDGQPPEHLAQTPPERHLAYAITWFAMMAALLGVYLAFHGAQGRLSLKRNRSETGL